MSHGDSLAYCGLTTTIGTRISLYWLSLAILGGALGMRSPALMKVAFLMPRLAYAIHLSPRTKEPI